MSIPSSWTLVTVTYNSARKLSQYWRGIQIPPGVEWIVVDNASSDESADLAEELGARVIKLNQNIGFGAANNIGFRAGDGKYVAFVNPDVNPDLQSLDLLKSFVDQNPLDLVSPQLINDDGSLQPNGRGLPYLSDKVSNRLKRAKVGEYLQFAAPGTERVVSWLMGAVVIASRDRFTELGPWDERFFVYYEDSDLGLRNARQAGRSVVLGTPQWLHGWARETRSLNLQAWRLEIPSLIKFYTRYPRLFFRASTRVRAPKDRRNTA